MIDNNSSTKKIVTRFAPSPTGFMHVGGVRTALYAWAWARKNNGTFILRIEDTDKAREVEGSVAHIMESLKWLGITWDEGPDIGGPHAPYLQSQRLESYKKYARVLIDKGLAYPDPYKEEEVEKFREEAKTLKRAFLYREHRPETFEGWDGTKPLRFKVPEIKNYKWNDVVRGELSAGVEALEDFILIKSDGYPTYNFAHIIDDLEMGVTHIMRADEFIASTPKFLSLYEALEITPPAFVTLPPILGEEGTKKLGKRDGAKDILEYRNEGFLPSAVVNFLVFLGWNPGDEREILKPQEFVDIFDISRIHKKGAMLDEEKLNWINKEHIKLESKEEQFTMIKKYFDSYDDVMLKKLQPTIIERITHYGELVEVANEFSYLNKRENPAPEKLLWKEIPKENIIKHLEYILSIMDNLDFGSVEKIKEIIYAYANDNGKGEVLSPLRVSLSARDKSPDPFTLLYVLGKEESVIRIKNAIKILSS